MVENRFIIYNTKKIDDPEGLEALANTISQTGEVKVVMQSDMDVVVTYDGNQSALREFLKDILPKGYDINDDSTYTLSGTNKKPGMKPEDTSGSYDMTTDNPQYEGGFLLYFTDGDQHKKARRALKQRELVIKSRSLTFIFTSATQSDLDELALDYDKLFSGPVPEDFIETLRHDLVHFAKTYRRKPRETSLDELALRSLQMPVHLEHFKVRYDSDVYPVSPDNPDEIPPALYEKLQLATNKSGYQVHNPRRSSIGLRMPRGLVDAVKKIEGVTAVVPDGQYDLESDQS